MGVAALLKHRNRTAGSLWRINPSVRQAPEQPAAPEANIATPSQAAASFHSSLNTF
jgi:hypothetical protein